MLAGPSFGPTTREVTASLSMLHPCIVRIYWVEMCTRKIPPKCLIMYRRTKANKQHMQNPHMEQNALNCCR